MHEILNSFNQKPIPKFQQSLLNFEKPQNFSKTPKPRIQNIKMHEEWDIRSLPSEETLEKAWETLGKEVRSEWKRFGRWKDKGIEREREIERNEVRIARGSIYRTLVKLDEWRCREVSRIWPSTDTSVEKVSRYKTSDIRDEARSIHQLSELR